MPRDIELPPPGPGEVRIAQAAVGVNFLDVCRRTGQHAVPSLPAALGVEGAGVVEAIGPGVTELAIGDRVAYAGLPVGQVAGPIPPISVEDLGPRRSIALARPSVIGYSADRRLYAPAVAHLFAYLEAARPEIVIGRRWPLDAAAEAHRALEAGATTGSTVLLP